MKMSGHNNDVERLYAKREETASGSCAHGGVDRFNYNYG